MDGVVRVLLSQPLAAVVEGGQLRVLPPHASQQEPLQGVTVLRSEDVPHRACEREEREGVGVDRCGAQPTR